VNEENHTPLKVWAGFLPVQTGHVVKSGLEKKKKGSLVDSRPGVQRVERVHTGGKVVNVLRRAGVAN